jgi:hypothetical protein
MAGTLTPTSNAAGVAAVQDILKEVWVSDNLESQLLEDTVLLDWIEDVTEFTDSDGLKASVPLYTGRTGGVSARAIGQKLAPADHQKVGKAYYNYKNLYLQIEVQGPVVKRMKTNRQAAVREVDLEVNRGIDSFKFDLQRQLHRDGTGRITLAAIPGGAASATILLGAANYPVIERGWLYEGQLLDCGTLANPQLDFGAHRVVSVTDSPTAPAVVVEATGGNPAQTAGSHLFLHGNATAGSVSNEVSGLQTLADDADVIGGINPATAGYGYWKAVVEGNSSVNRAVSLSLLNTLERKIKQKGGQVDAIMCSLGVEQKFYELLQPQIRYAGDASLKAGDTEAPKFNNKELGGDAHCLPNRVYMLKKKAIQMYSAGKLEWQNQTTGGDILAWRQDYDAFVGRAAKYGQVGTNRRNTLGVLEDISE